MTEIWIKPPSQDLSLRAGLGRNSSTLPHGSHEKRSLGCAASERSNLHLQPVPLSAAGDRFGLKTTGLAMTEIWIKPPSQDLSLRAGLGSNSGTLLQESHQKRSLDRTGAGQGNPQLQRVPQPPAGDRWGLMTTGPARTERWLKRRTED